MTIRLLHSPCIKYMKVEIGLAGEIFGFCLYCTTLIASIIFFFFRKVKNPRSSICNSVKALFFLLVLK